MLIQNFPLNCVKTTASDSFSQDLQIMPKWLRIMQLFSQKSYFECNYCLKLCVCCVPKFSCDPFLTRISQVGISEKNWGKEKRYSLVVNIWKENLPDRKQNKWLAWWHYSVQSIFPWTCTQRFTEWKLYFKIYLVLTTGS